MAGGLSEPDKMEPCVWEQVIVQGDALKKFQIAGMEAQVVPLENCCAIVRKVDGILGASFFSTFFPMPVKFTSGEYQAVFFRPAPERFGFT